MITMTSIKLKTIRCSGVLDALFRYLLLPALACFSFSAQAQTAVALETGWNLIGNGDTASLNVADASLFGNPDNVTTVWKWLPASSKWAFYAPAMPTLSDYAASKNYDVLATIAGGEGFWVNAKKPFSVSLPNGTAVLASSIRSGLQPGWSLIAIGETRSPGEFNLLLSAITPAAGTVPINVTTLWAWDSGHSKWYFYAPGMTNGGEFAAYIQSKSYLDFTSSNRNLGTGVGFWVNKPGMATTTAIIEVDAAQTGGAVHDLTGVNKKPSFGSPTPGVTWNAASLYQAFGVSQVRLHDSNVDLCTTYTAATKLDSETGQPVPGCDLAGTAEGGQRHFTWTPISSADADLNNPNNYNFTSVDEALSGVSASGAAVYLRLGDSFNGPNDTGDPVAWAKVAANIYKHVLGQFKPTPGIAVDPAYVEIFNEPDGGFWKGSVGNFYTLFTETAQRVRAAASAAGKTVSVGGAGFTRNILNNSKDATNVAKDFIANVGASTLDFYSAHLYDSCATATLASPANFLRALRKLVNDQGGSAKPLHVTEWNIGLGSQCGNDFYADQRMQSFAGGMLTLMQDPAQNIEAAHFYAGMPIMALFDFATVTGTARINPSAWAFWAHAKLRGATTISAKVCPQGGVCVAGYAAESAPLLALAGQAGGVQKIAISNDGDIAVTYLLRLKGLTSSNVTATISTPPAGARDLPASGNPIVADATALTALIASVSKDIRAMLPVNGGQIELTLSIPAHTVQVVEVRAF